MPGPHCLLYKYTIYSYGRGEANTLRWLHAWLQTNEIFTSPDLTKPAEQHHESAAKPSTRCQHQEALVRLKLVN